MRQETQKAFDNILDCMSGSDGGVKFALFLGGLKEIDDRAKNGDLHAEIIINIMLRFSRAVDILSERNINETNNSNEKGNRKSKKRILRKA
jgi:hypothetical protein